MILKANLRDEEPILAARGCKSISRHMDWQDWELNPTSPKLLISALRVATRTNKYLEYLQTSLEGEMCPFLSCQCGFLRFRGSQAAPGAK